LENLIKVYRKSNKNKNNYYYVSNDNRRLACFQKAGLTRVPVNIVAEQAWVPDWKVVAPEHSNDKAENGPFNGMKELPGSENRGEGSDVQGENEQIQDHHDVEIVAEEGEKNGKKINDDDFVMLSNGRKKEDQDSVEEAQAEPEDKNLSARFAMLQNLQRDFPSDTEEGMENRLSVLNQLKELVAQWSNPNIIKGDKSRNH
jgi:hypothetical protein